MKQETLTNERMARLREICIYIAENPEKVISEIRSACQDYCGVTWIDMLRVGKKMPHNLSLLASSPDYYFELRKKEPEMHYTKINDRVYISGEGNHRTAIARIIAYYTGSMMLHGVTCDEYRIDFALLDKFNRLKSLLAERFPHMEVQVIRKNTVRDDGPGWMIDRHSIAFLLINHKRNKQMEITSSEIDAVYRDLSRVNLLSRYLIKSKIKTIL